MEESTVMKYIVWLLPVLLLACGTPRDTTSTTVTRPAHDREGIDPDDQVIVLQNQPLTLADYLIRVPGLIVRGNRVSIRGMGAPLYIVDEVQLGRNYTQANNAVSVFDIDRVEVLKNPADLALYGYQGQNGVIKIYTKRQ